MSKIIVYVDNVAYAEQLLQPMLASGNERTMWILVACPPRLTHHASKWVSHSAYEDWCTQWADSVFTVLLPVLQRHGDTVHTVLAQSQLSEQTEALQREYGSAHVMDARRPKFGEDLQAVTKDQSASHNSLWEVPGAVAGLGALLMLAAE